MSRVSRRDATSRAEGREGEMRRGQKAQLELGDMRRWGGRGGGGGRKRVAARSSPPHRPRPSHKAPWPVHVTLRARETIPSLRGGRVFAFVRHSLAASHKGAFHVVHLSVQS